MPKIAYYRNCKFRTERRRDRTAPRRAFGALRAPRSSRSFCLGFIPTTTAGQEKALFPRKLERARA